MTSLRAASFAQSDTLSHLHNLQRARLAALLFLDEVRLHEL